MFEKSYNSSEEYAIREAIYNQNIEKFKTITDYVPGVNPMTDWTEEEINARKNLKELNDDDKTIR